MIEEKWLPVVGYEGLYEVSSSGRMRTLRQKTPRLMACGVGSHGYRQVGLVRPGEKLKMLRVHRLVLEAFVGPCPLGCESLHGKGGRADASLENLSWGTPKQNQAEDRARDHTTNRGEKCGNAKLTYEQILELRERREAGEKVHVLAAYFGINPSTVSKIVKGKRWQYPPEEW